MFLKGSYPQKRLQDFSKAVKSILCQHFAKQLFPSNLREISAKDDESSLMMLHFVFVFQLKQGRLGTWVRSGI